MFTETSSGDFDAVKYRGFLENYGVYNQGAWRTEDCGQDRHQANSIFGNSCFVLFSIQDTRQQLIRNSKW